MEEQSTGQEDKSEVDWDEARDYGKEDAASCKKQAWLFSKHYYNSWLGIWTKSNLY